MFTPDWMIEEDMTPEIEAMYALRDMHIDASVADDMDTAALANLLIYPTESELFNEDEDG